METSCNIQTYFWREREKRERGRQDKIMKLICPQITWHGGDSGKNAPILSLDFHPTDRQLLVTAGSDAEARVSRTFDNGVESTDNMIKTKVWVVDGELPRYLFTLSGHESPINCVRWSPDGNSVAAGADGGSIIFWSLPPRYAKNRRAS